MTTFSCLFAYVGPDTFLPLTSAVSAIAGVAMFLWGTGTRSLMRAFTERFRSGVKADGSAPQVFQRRLRRFRPSDVSVAESAATAAD